MIDPKTLAEWREDAEGATYYGGNEQEQADRILALLDALADAWDEGWQANDDRVRSFENPYRGSEQ